MNVLEYKASLLNFLRWFESNGFDTYDNNDIWASKLGEKVKSIYIKKPKIGMIPLATLHLVDIFIPSVRKLLSNKKAFSCAKAEIIMSYLNIDKIMPDSDYKNKTINILKDLTNICDKTKHGIGWGVPYEWVTPNGNLPLNSPNIVQTSHCFHAFDKMYNEYQNKQYLDTLRRIVNFVYKDLKIEGTAGVGEPSKYGFNFPVLTYNTIALRAHILMRAYELFGDEKYKIDSMQNIKYLAEFQNEDGSWNYSHDLDTIDNFHTCYILKSLYGTYSSYNNSYILETADKGFEYYEKNFFRNNGSLIHFTKNKNPKFRYIELLDYAEAIKLEVQMKKSINREFSYSEELVNQVISNFQTSKGSFITRVNSIRIKNKIPYLRWPQAPLFNALTEYFIYAKM